MTAKAEGRDFVVLASGEGARLSDKIEQVLSGTANLDEKNEEMIADLIAQMPITRIVVAHRPALIRRAGK